MKKTLLTLLLAFVFTFICNGLTNPSLLYFKSDFRNSSVVKPLGDWSCRGSGKTAKEVEIGKSGRMLNTVFPSGSPAFLPMDFEDFGIVYISNSTTEEGGAADEWLISPPIDLSDVPSDILLSFDVFAYGCANSPKYEVYVSTTGCDPEDFTKPVYTGKSSNDTDYPVCERKYISLSGISGPEVYLAFVNKSRNAQILGFKDIEIAEYTLNVSNNTETFLIEPKDVNVTLSVGAITPVPCDGFTATLSYEGNEQTFVSKTPLGGSYMQTKVEFPTPLRVEFGETLDYALTITPNYDGATPSVFNATVACSEGFESVCVMEEGTATWCGYCIRGTAALNQYSDKYGDRFIGIAVHGSNDPMRVPEYLDPFLVQSGINGYPNAWFNRRVLSDPQSPELVEEILSERVGYSVSIKEVTYDENGSDMVTVKYAPRLSFSTSGADMTAVAIVTEDNVKGNNADWNQTNYYSGASKMDIEGAFGKDAWPYFKEYCESGDIIPFPLITYGHVARGIFNSYLGGGAGATLPATWTVNEEQEFTLSFELPLINKVGSNGVQDWKNTHIVILLLDNATGKVLSAAKMGASDYNTSSVEEVHFADGVNISRQGNMLIVESMAADITVDAYNMHGYCLHSSHVDGAYMEVDASSFSGPIVLRVTSGNDTYVKKLVF